MKRIEISENGIYIVFEIADGETRIIRFSPLICGGRLPGAGLSMLSVPDGGGLHFMDFSDTNDQKGRIISVTQADDSGAEVVTRFRFINGIAAVAVETSGSMRGLSLRLNFPGETEIMAVNGSRCGQVRCLTNGYVLAWQSDNGAKFIRENGCGVLLLPQGGGECLISVSAESDGAFGELTRFRRAVRRKTRDSRTLGVFFDGADCPAEALPALIMRAADCGFNYFGVDTAKAPAIPADIVKSGMTPAVRLAPADCDSARRVCAVIRENRAGAVLLPESAGLSLVDEILAARRDTVIGSAAAGLGCSGRGMLAAVGGDSVRNALYFTAPEQVLTYCDIPADGGGERLASALIGSMLTRMCVRGRLDLLDEGDLALVKAAVAVHKRIRGAVAGGVPVFPETEGGAAYGVSCGGEIFLTVTGKSGGEVVVRAGDAAEVIFPADFGGNVKCVSENKIVVKFGKDNSAVLLRLRI